MSQPLPSAPNTASTAENIAGPIQQTAKDLLSPTKDSPALGVCEKMSEDLTRETDGLRTKSDNAKKLAEELGAVTEKDPPKLPEGNPDPQIQRRVKLPGERAPQSYGDYLLQPEPKPGSESQKAEDLMNQDNYGEALRHYEEAYKKGEIDDKFYAMLRGRAEEAVLARRLEVPGDVSKVTEAITKGFEPDEVKKVLVDNWERRIPTGKKSANDTSTVEVDGRKYFVKQLKADPEDLSWFAENEVVGAELAHALGIPVPGVGVHLIYNDRNEIAGARLVYRILAGEDVGQLTAGETYLYRKELSESRAFRAWIMDHDAKLDNILRSSSDGKIYDIDLASRDIRGRFKDPTAMFHTKGIDNLDHWYARSFSEDTYDIWNPNPAGIRNRDIGTPRFSVDAKQNLCERSLSYNAAKPMIDKIGKLVQNEVELRRVLTNGFKKVHGDIPGVKVLVDDAVKNLTLSNENLPETMKHLNKRNGLPIKDGPDGNGLLSPPGTLRGLRPTDRDLLALASVMLQVPHLEGDLSSAEKPVAERLQYVADSVKVYRFVQKKDPRAISELYFNGYIDRMHLVAPGRKVPELADIDQKSEYTLTPLNGVADIVVREANPSLRPGFILAVFKDKSIRFVPAPN